VCLGQRVGRLGGQGRSPSGLGEFLQHQSVQQAGRQVTFPDSAKMSIAIIAILVFKAYRKD
jgi:hypothetical protein